MTPEMQAGLNFMKAAIEAAMPPLQVAHMVFNAIKKGRFYILTHPEWIEVVQMRTDNLLRLGNPQDPAPTVAKLINPSR